MRRERCARLAIRVLPTDHLLPFLLTVYVLIVIPGPSVLFTVSRGVALGRRAALATVLGNTSGLLLQLVLVVIGLGSILARSDTGFTVLKLVGAAYLSQRLRPVSARPAPSRIMVTPPPALSRSSRRGERPSHARPVPAASAQQPAIACPAPRQPGPSGGRGTQRA
jgi:hypothetical protein